MVHIKKKKITALQCPVSLLFALFPSHLPTFDTVQVELRYLLLSVNSQESKIPKGFVTSVL